MIFIIIMIIIIIMTITITMTTTSYLIHLPKVNIKPSIPHSQHSSHAETPNSNPYKSPHSYKFQKDN